MSIRRDQGGGIRLLAAVLILVVVIVAAVSVAFTTALPDANEPSSENLGYFDTKAIVSYGLTQNPESECPEPTPFNPFDDETCETVGGTVSPYRGLADPVVKFDEHAALPTGPATVFEIPSGTAFVQTCTGWAMMTVAGPSINSFDQVGKKSNTKTFSLAEEITFAWGHFHVNQQGAFKITIELFLDDCYSYDGTQRVEALFQTLEFDGVNDQ